MEKREWWVIDLHREQRFGPFTNKKAAMKTRTVVRVIPDIGLEIASNVYVSTDIEAHGFPVGDLAKVNQENAGLQS